MNRETAFKNPQSWCVWLLVLLILIPTTVPADSDLVNVWKSKKSLDYQPYHKSQLGIMHSLFKSIILGNVSADINNQLAPLNLTLTADDNYYLLSEMAKPYSGQGLFIVSKHSNSKVLLQAPHAFHDMKSGVIALNMMRENALKALAINTVNRTTKFKSNGDKKSDMAHLTESLFVQFSKAFVEVYSDGKIVQLHGFNSKKWSDSNEFELIISNGTRTTNLSMAKQGQCLSHALSLQSHIYPRDVNFLGGTTNAIGSVVRKQGFTGFMHIEMSLNLRKKLYQSADMRRLFVECIR